MSAASATSAAVYPRSELILLSAGEIVKRLGTLSATLREGARPRGRLCGFAARIEREAGEARAGELATQTVYPALDVRCAVASSGSRLPVRFSAVNSSLSHRHDLSRRRLIRADQAAVVGAMGS